MEEGNNNNLPSSTNNSPPTSPSKRTTNSNSTTTTTTLRSRVSSHIIDNDYLTEYVNLKCLEKVTRKDFDEATFEQLRQLPLFQAIQVVHRFNDSVGPRVVNRSAFLISIIRSTQRWWNPSANSSSSSNTGTTTNTSTAAAAPPPPTTTTTTTTTSSTASTSTPQNTTTTCTDPSPAATTTNKLFTDGPNTSLVIQLCMNGGINPDVFTPSVCHVLQLLSPEQVVQVAQGFGSNSLALHVANDSYYAKQQLFLSMAHAALMNFPPNTGNPTSGMLLLDESEATANEAAALGRRRADASAAAQLPGILSEFIARTCATSKTICESDLDGSARDGLRRVALIQAMQAIQHFSVSMSDQIQKRSAYLMGILRGQELHWERSRAAKQYPGGSKELLNLHPRLLLRIAHLCLDGHCFPSDFAPEVCFELQELDVDSAIKAVMLFNNNKRIAAGAAGGVSNRVGFFHGLLRNLRQADAKNNIGSPNNPLTSISSPPSSSELNASAKPFTPSSGIPPLILAGNSTSNGPTSLVTSPSSSLHAVATEKSAFSSFSPVATIPITVTTTNTSTSTTTSTNGPPQTSSGENLRPFSPHHVVTTTNVSENSAAGAASPILAGKGSQQQNPKELSRLLDSSRDAISFLTSALARSRTSEIRLKRELEASQAQVQHLTQALIGQRETNLRMIENVRAQILVNVTRSFEGLAQSFGAEVATNLPSSASQANNDGGE